MKENIQKIRPVVADTYPGLLERKRQRPVHCYIAAEGQMAFRVDKMSRIKKTLEENPDILACARAVGLTGMRTIPSHLPDVAFIACPNAQISCIVDDGNNKISVYGQIDDVSKETLETQAICGVSATLMYLWNHLKDIDETIRLQDIRVLAKTNQDGEIVPCGSDLPDWLAPYVTSLNSLQGVNAAVLVMSDRAAQGIYPDESGPMIQDWLERKGARTQAYKIIPDEKDEIEKAVTNYCRTQDVDLLLASGGTGPGPRDVTPDILEGIFDRRLDGLGDLLRTESMYFTDTAWLSRMTAGMVGRTLVIALPGSPKAIRECLNILAPFLRDALVKIKEQGWGA